MLFLWFMEKNGILYAENGHKRIAIKKPHNSYCAVLNIYCDNLLRCIL